MKTETIRPLIVVAVTLLLTGSVTTVRADNTNLTRAAQSAALGPVGSIHFDDSQKIDVQGVLQIYKLFSGLELVIDSRAAQVHTQIIPHVDFAESFTRAEALKLMEKNLLEESGIVIIHLDDKRVSVTYNDALPIMKAFDDNLATNAVAVLRVQKFYTWPPSKLGSKLTHYALHVYQVFKNECNENLNHDIEVYALIGRTGVPSEECTIYLERYDPATDTFNKTKGLWVLVGGDATNGVSHVDLKAVSR